MHPHQLRRAAALAAGFLVAALIGTTGGAAAAPAAHRDPTPSSPTPSPSDPGTDPSTPPRRDMSVVGSSVKGHVGGTVKVVVMVYNAGVRHYTLTFPRRLGIVAYTGRCDSPEQERCVVSYKSGGTSVDTRVLEFAIVSAGTTQVPVTLRPKGVTDPNPGNNTAYGTITNGIPGTPPDMAVSADDASGRVGDVVTVDVRIRTSTARDYRLTVGTSDDIDYVGQCDQRRDTESGEECVIVRRRGGDVDTYQLRFKVTTAGEVQPRIAVAPDGVADPNLDDNAVRPVVTGLPAANSDDTNVVTSDDDTAASGGSGGDGLPTTGRPVAAFAVAGVALFGLGAMLFLATRRRRRMTPYGR